MTGRLSLFAAPPLLVCLTGALFSRPAAAALTGGAMKVSSLATFSGGRMAAGGSRTAKAVTIGAMTNGACLNGGRYCLTPGGTPAVVTFVKAKNDLAAAHCYPVPFKPSAGHTKITFTGLTRAARIRIYSISGELVRALDKSDASDSLDWDVHNSGGSAVDSGVYLYLIKSSGQTRKGKLMIIR